MVFSLLETLLLFIKGKENKEVMFLATQRQRVEIQAKIAHNFPSTLTRSMQCQMSVLLSQEE